MTKRNTAKPVRVVSPIMEEQETSASTLQDYQKFSNNNHPFAKEYLLSWFLDLSSSYQAFNYRLILMPEAIREHFPPFYVH